MNVSAQDSGFCWLVLIPAILGYVTGRIPALETTLILAGFGVQFVMPTIFYFIPRVYPPQMVGKMSGIWMGLGTFGGVLGLYIAGITIKS